jgi:hypothetical protein
VYVEPQVSPGFGDIYAGAWFFDAFLRRDAVPLVRFQTRIRGAGGPTVDAWRAARPAPNRDTVFAHGQQHAAMLMADDCEAETILQRGPRNRLVFAAIKALPAGDAGSALQSRAFRRFPLEPGDLFAGGLVEFQSLFAMSVDGVNVDPDPRVASLNPETLVGLEMRWAAYVTRRGPLTHVDNGTKLARLLAADDDRAALDELKREDALPGETQTEVGRAVARALSQGWRIEGEVMNNVADVYESAGSSAQVLDGLTEDLSRLSEYAGQAAEALRQTRG